MERDKLKDFVDAHREAFESELPEAQHLARFEKKLAAAPGLPGGRKPVYRMAAWAVAASLAGLLLLQIPGLTPIDSRLESPTDSPALATQEIEELSRYYQMQIDDLLARMEEIDKQHPSYGASEVMQDTRQLLHDNYMFERTVLPTLPGSNSGLYAVTQHYSNSLDGLTFMFGQLQKVTSKPTTNNHKTTIQ